MLYGVLELTCQPIAPILVAHVVQCGAVELPGLVFVCFSNNDCPINVHTYVRVLVPPDYGF